MLCFGEEDQQYSKTQRMDYTKWQIGLLGLNVQSTVEMQFKCTTNVTVLKTYETLPPNCGMY